MPENEPEIAWVGAEDLPVEFANIFAAVIAENAVFLNIGSLVPPAVETEEQLAAFRFIPVKPIARIALAPGNLDGLIATLESARREWNSINSGEKP
ncbi:MAG: hypothetical protein ABW196_01085 [Solirubrobacterales bacterium]